MNRLRVAAYKSGLEIFKVSPSHVLLTAYNYYV